MSPVNNMARWLALMGQDRLFPPNGIEDKAAQHLLVGQQKD